MKRLAVILIASLIPLAMFAQMPFHTGGDEMLKKMNLTDTQIAQVQEIVKTASIASRDALIHLRLVRAQIDEAVMLSTASPNLAAIEKLADEQSLLRGDMEKNFLVAEVKLIQIIGKDNYENYQRFIQQRMAFRGKSGLRSFQGRGWIRMPAIIQSGPSNAPSLSGSSDGSSQ